jgi:hypothetical protein
MWESDAVATRTHAEEAAFACPARPEQENTLCWNRTIQVKNKHNGLKV